MSVFSPETKRGFRNLDAVIAILRHGGVGVMPTDTIYGIVGSALSKKAVVRIYRLRKRNPNKPFIVLISSIGDIKKFGVKLNQDNRRLIIKHWPGKVSIILPMSHKSLANNQRYLHRGAKTLAFRLPAKKSLREFLKKTGPLVAPSANIEGKPPAKTITAAKKYFGDKVDFYTDGGRLNAKPSKIIKLENGKMLVFRK